MKHTIAIMFSMVAAGLLYPACSSHPCMAEDQITPTTPRTSCSCKYEVDYCGGPDYTQVFYDTVKAAVDWCDACRQLKVLHGVPDDLGGAVSLVICSCTCEPVIGKVGASGADTSGTDNMNLATPYDSSCNKYTMGSGAGGGSGGGGIGGSSVSTGTGLGGGFGTGPSTTAGAGASPTTGDTGVGAGNAWQRWP